MTTTEPRAYPFSFPDRLDVDPLFAELRREQPLCRVEMPYGGSAWLATRYEDTKQVLADPRFSRAAAAGRDHPRIQVRCDPPGGIMQLDPPEHTRLRRLVANAFTIRRVEQIRPHAEQIANELVDAMLAKGAPADLVEDFALPLPLTVICGMLGVPVEDHADFRIWADALLSTTKYPPEQISDYVARMRGYLASLIDQRRTKAQDDLLSALVAARDDEDRLSEEELLLMAQALLVGGHETTSTQLPNFVYVLLTHPEQLAMLRADLDLVPQAVEELLRYVPMVVSTLNIRYAIEDVELSGGTVRAGEPVLVAPQSANRDESIYSNPDELNLRRQEAPHVSFGHGPHHCLGAPLARMELQVALRTLLRRLPGLRFAAGEEGIVWKTGLIARGPEHLPIAWDAA